MRLRLYEAADEAALVEVWIESWRSAGLEQPVVTKEDLAARVPRELARRWTVTVADESGQLAGFLAVCLEEARLDQLFIHPSFQGCGLGHAFLKVARNQMLNGFWLSTQAANHRARRFYEHQGMMLDRFEGDLGNERVFYVSQATLRSLPRAALSSKV